MGLVKTLFVILSIISTSFAFADNNETPKEPTPVYHVKALVNQLLPQVQQLKCPSGAPNDLYTFLYRSKSATSDYVDGQRIITIVDDFKVENANTSVLGWPRYRTTFKLAVDGQSVTRMSVIDESYGRINSGKKDFIPQFSYDCIL